MTLISHPQPGTIVRVDLSEGFRPPEMGKRRPAIVLSPPIPGRQLMCTIVPLSTTPPKPPHKHHLKITLDPPLPAPYPNPEMWVKGDIVLTVAFHRLRLLFSGWDSGQRVYDVRVLEPDILEKVRACVRAGLGL
jgi:mRNA interferase MazF